MELDQCSNEETDLFDLYEAIHVPLPEVQFSDNTEAESHEEQPSSPPAEAVDAQPFRRWLSTLRRRHVQRRDDHGTDGPRRSLDPFTRNHDASAQSRHEREPSRRHSESMSSSMGCVTTMRSASMTNASTSIAPHSDSVFRGKARIGNRGSHYSDARRSMDSHRGPLGPIMDESAWLRSLQRRKIVEELIASEEGYIADLKVLINVRENAYNGVLC
jgi:hypothetical protein